MTFTPDFFINNRRRLLSHAKADVIVVGANGLLQSASDMTFPFRQESNFWYLTGIDEPDIVLVMKAGEEFLIAADRDSLRETFDGAVDTIKLAKVSGIKKVLGEKEGPKLLKDILGKSKSVATLVPPKSYIKQAGFYTNPARARLLRQIKAGGPKLKVTDIREILTEVRMVKQPAEIAAIQEAIDISVEGFDEVLANRGEFKNEYELEAAIGSSFRKRGASGLAFPTIVAAGINACTLHYVLNDQLVKPKDLVLIDAGAKVSHYNADITRTVSLGKPSPRQLAVLEAVVAAQEFAIAQLKPGLTLKNYVKAVDKYMGEKLAGLGLIKEKTPEQIRRYFPHGVSHFLGLDPHDVRTYDKPLEPGMVLTVEPGIYIKEEAIGVRIEDDILITKENARVLSAKLPKLFV